MSMIGCLEPCEDLDVKVAGTSDMVTDKAQEAVRSINARAKDGRPRA
jgi:hypothetical protein